MADNEELLPCPFCGGAMQHRYALFPTEGDRDAIIHAAPTSCPIEGAFSIDTFDNGVSVAEAWNTRPLSRYRAGGEAVEVEWVVNDIAELGVKIGDQFFFCYKGRSLTYADKNEGGAAVHDDGSPMHWRPVFKREFGECIHPINYSDLTKIGTVSLDDSDEWQELPAAKEVNAPLYAIPAQTREAVLEEAAKVADDHTPEKHAATLAAHVTGSTIAAAIRALASSPEPATTALIDDVVTGQTPMSKWVGSVDYSTYDDFERYLETQLREKLHLKANLDKKRHESPEDDSLATFVDGGSGALEAALATYRTVRERVAASPPPPSVSEPVPAGYLYQHQIGDGTKWEWCFTFDRGAPRWAQFIERPETCIALYASVPIPAVTDGKEGDSV